MQLNYDELADILRPLPIAMSISECHGVLTGLIISSQSVTEDNWFEHVFANADDVENLAVNDRSLLNSWFTFTSEQLEQDDLSFIMCLPDDNQSLKDRLNALADWCHGFLYGLAATGEVDFETLPAEASETLSDLGEIGKVDAVASFDEDEAEFDLLEINEYVRMACLSLYDDVRAQQKLRAATAFLDKTIH